MGIKYLNRFIKEEAYDTLKFISLSELSGKKIVVDISIYMYRYISDGSLIENMYLMLSLFRHYNIIPVFIFDGKPPDEKKILLEKRRENKKDAEEEYKLLKKQLETNLDENERHEIQISMDTLKKKFIQISKIDIDKVKNLIRAYGATYYDAPGEADELCAMLTIKGKVWACLSEDMDMFVYGCPRVIRYMSLLNHTIVLYDMKKILEKLGISQKELREICILSGTDYNTAEKNEKVRNLYSTLKQFKKYHKAKQTLQSNVGFYDWLNKNTHYINDYDLLINIYSMFDLTRETHIEEFNKIRISYGPQIKSEIREILIKDGFLFPL
jgi:flap endonuclease-1